MVIISIETLKYSKKTLSQYNIIEQNTKRTPLGSSLVTTGAEFECILEELTIRKLIRWVHYVSLFRQFVFYCARFR
jgi:hypothetical protein